MFTEDKVIIHEFGESDLPRFAAGTLVHHKLFDYRGVIIDVHPSYQGTKEWYERVAKTLPPKDRPWYEVLVHGSSQVAYVAQRNLEHDVTGLPVDNPLLRMFFTEFHADGYRVGGMTN